MQYESIDSSGLYCQDLAGGMYESVYCHDGKIVHEVYASEGCDIDSLVNKSMVMPVVACGLIDSPTDSMEENEDMPLMALVFTIIACSLFFVGAVGASVYFKKQNRRRSCD